MSKGAGKVMREALAVVLEQPGTISSYDVAALVYDVQPGPDGIIRLTDAQIVAVRRALVVLVRAGKVADMGRSFIPTARRHYATLEVAAQRDSESRALARALGGRHSGPSDPIRPRPRAVPQIQQPLEWTASELERRDAVLRGETVLANMHKGHDVALIAWAKKSGLFVPIERRSKSKWQSSYIEGRDGDRAIVIWLYREHVLPRLIGDIEELRGKVLGCWCYPKACHGDLLLEALAGTPTAS